VVIPTAGGFLDVSIGIGEVDVDVDIWGGSGSGRIRVWENHNVMYTLNFFHGSRI
jgi:hypothetical protein